MDENRYTKLDTLDEDIVYLPSRKNQRSSILVLLASIMTAFGAGVLGTLLLSRTPQSCVVPETNFLTPAGDIKVQFQYNDTFPGPPTWESEWAWLNLMPDGLGAVQNNKLGDAIVTFSVFHQLHCLMELRHAVYENWNGSRHSHMKPHHSRHCLEYLRQSLICNADTNLEYRVVMENGVKETPGWDVKRCRNFDAIVKWSQEWRAFDGKIPSQRAEINDPDILQGRVIVY